MSWCLHAGRVQKLPAGMSPQKCMQAATHICCKHQLQHHLRMRQRGMEGMLKYETTLCNHPQQTSLTQDTTNSPLPPGPLPCILPTPHLAQLHPLAPLQVPHNLVACVHQKKVITTLSGPSGISKCSAQVAPATALSNLHPCFGQPMFLTPLATLGMPILPPGRLSSAKSPARWWFSRGERSL